MVRVLAVAASLLVAVAACISAHGAAPRVVLVDFGDMTWAPGPEILVAATPRRGPSGVYAIDRTGRPRLVARNAACARWSPDGTRVAFVQNGLLVIERADGRDRTVVIRIWPGGKPTRFLTHCEAALAWSPDGSEIAYGKTGRIDGFFKGQVWVADLAAHHARQVWESDGGAEFAWSPDGRQLAVGYCPITEAGDCAPGMVDVVSARTGRGWRVSGTFQSDPCLDWAPGQLLAISGALGGVFVAHPGSRAVRYETGNAIAGCAAWSPSGTRLAAAMLEPGETFDAISVASTETKHFRPLVRLHRAPWEPGSCAPVWSPDGRSLAFWWMFGRGYHTFERVYVADAQTGRLHILLRTPWPN